MLHISLLVWPRLAVSTVAEALLLIHFLKRKRVVNLAMQKEKFFPSDGVSCWGVVNFARLVIPKQWLALSNERELYGGAFITRCHAIAASLERGQTGSAGLIDSNGRA